MAKSEKAAAQAAQDETENPAPEGVYDAEELLDEDLSELPDETSISGRWIVQFVRGFIQTGVGDKGPWTMLNLNLNPVRPLNEDIELTDEQLENLPRVRHRVFYNEPAAKRAFVELAAKFNTEPGTLREMLEDMKGEEAIATIKPGKDNRGEFEYKLSAFKALPDTYQVEASAAAA